MENATTPRKPRQVRRYGLFQRVNGKWVREYPNLAYPKAQAVRVFQSALLAACLGGGPERCLRPIKPATTITIE